MAKWSKVHHFDRPLMTMVGGLDPSAVIMIVFLESNSKSFFADCSLRLILFVKMHISKNSV